jgi:hypothetical protein
LGLAAIAYPFTPLHAARIQKKRPCQRPARSSRCDQKIVSLDRRTDGAGNDGPTQMRPMFGLCGCYLNPEHGIGHLGFPPNMLLLIETPNTALGM